MSIADKITSIENHLKDDYQSIANLGADLTNVDKNIENISSLLDGVYDVLPKTSFQEGTSVTIEGGLKGKIDFDEGKVGFGDTEQSTTQGRQLFQGISYAVNTVGVDFTYTLDGGIKAVGLATADAFSMTTGNSSPYRFDLEAGTYIISGAGNNTRVQVINSSGTQLASDTGSGASFTLSATTSVYVRIMVLSGTNINHTFYPMLETGSTAHDWEQYTGGYASPSPNWEQEVKCVSGKNRCDGKFRQGGWGGTSSNRLFTTQNYPIKEGEEFTLSTNLNTTIYKYGVQIGSSPYPQSSSAGIIYDSGWITTKPFTFIASVSGYLGITVAKANGTDDISVDDISGVTWQLEKGSTSTPYLPYNTIQETIRGKNELEGIEFGDIDPQGGMPISSNSSFRSINYIPYDTSKTYYVSVNSVQPTNQGLNLRFYNASKQYIGYSTLTGSGSNFVITKGNQVTTTDLVPKYFRFRQTATAGPINSINDNVMIATISGATYEPYITPKTYQFSLGNNKLYEDCYIVGSPDNWKFVDNYEKYTMTGEETINMQNQNTRFGFDLATASTDTTKASQVLAKSNYFKGIPFNDRNNSINSVYQICNGSSRSIQFNTGTMFEDKTAFTNWVRANHPYIVYLRETPIETPITDTTLITQLNNWYYSQSFNGTTILESNGDLPMIIKVRALKGE